MSFTYQFQALKRGCKWEILFSEDIIKYVNFILKPLWWLILCVNLTGLRDAQRASECYFSLEEISIWIRQLSKADGPPQGRRTSSNPLRGRTERRGRGRAHLLSLLKPWKAWPDLKQPPFSMPSSATELTMAERPREMPGPWALQSPLQFLGQQQQASRIPALIHSLWSHMLPS